MLDDAVRLAQDVTPYAVMAITACGTAVVTRVVDSSADAGVSFGQRVLRRLIGRDEGEDLGQPEGGQVALTDAVRALAAAPDDADLVAVLRVAIRRLLEADPALSAEIAGWPCPTTPATITVSTSGERSAAVGTNYGTINTGDTTRPGSGA